MNDLLRTGLDHLDAGRSLLPVNAKKRPHGPALKSTGHTLENAPSWKILQTERATEAQLRQWLTHPECGLGLITGHISRIVIIDADYGEGTALFERWGLTSRAHVRTKSGGLHWYVHHPGWPVRTLQSATSDKLESIRGIDSRADGGYAVLPPTEFGTSRYVALRNHFEVDHPSMMPPEVVALLGLDKAPEDRPAPTRPEWTTTPLRGTSQGHGAASGDDAAKLATVILERACQRVQDGRGRNDTGFWMATQLRDNRFSRAETETLLGRYVDHMPDVNTKGQTEPYTLQDAMTSVRQAFSSPAREPWKRNART